MAKKGKEGSATPSEQPVEPTPKTTKKRKASNSIEGPDGGVALKRVKMANRPEKNREKNPVPEMTRPLAKSKTKVPRVIKEKKKRRSRVTKPKTKVTRITKTNKIQRPVKSKAKIAKARRRVRIAQSPSQGDETSSDDWQEDTFSENDVANDNGRVGRGLGIGSCSSALNSFRKVFSLSSIWPDYTANDVPNVLQRTTNAQEIGEEACQNPYPRARERPARALTLHDIIPPKSMITKRMADRMAQHDRILERKIREEEQRIAALPRDEQGGNGEVERIYAALAREMQSVPAQVAVQNDHEAHEDAGFHDNAFDISNATPGYRETGFREKSVQPSAVTMSGALPAPDRNRLDEDIGHPATQDEGMPDEETIGQYRPRIQAIHDIEKRNNPVPSHEPLPTSSSQEITRYARKRQVIELSSGSSESSADEEDRLSASNRFPRHDRYSSNEVERDPTQRGLAAYDKHMDEHDVEGDDEDEGEEEDNEPEDGESEWEREEDLSSSDDVVDEEGFVPGRYAEGGARRPVLLRKMNNQLGKDQDLAGEPST